MVNTTDTKEATSSSPGTEIHYNKFLLCTSCTISYIIGTPEFTGATLIESAEITFPGAEIAVRVDFYEVNLYINDSDG